MSHAPTEPKVTLHIEVRSPDGTVKHVETITNQPAPVNPLVRLKNLLKETRHAG